MNIIFLHPAIRTYRFELFEQLASYDVEFLFTSINSENTPAGIETSKLLKKSKIKYKQCREISFFGKKNFSIDLLRVFKYDVVIFSCATSVPFLLLSIPLKFLGKKIIIFDEMWMYPVNILSYKLIRSYIRFLFKKTVDHAIVAGTKAKSYIENEYGYSSDKISIAYNTTVKQEISENFETSDKFKSLVEKIKSKNKPVILYLGRIVKYKGLDVLVKAFSNSRINATLLIVGDGPFKLECENLISQLKLINKTIFWGACDINDVPSFYKLADAFVLPTRFLNGEAVSYESWGFTINEAMAHGVPVITSDAVGAGYDLIKHNKTGWIFPSEDVDMLSIILKNLINDLFAAKTIGLNGKEYLNQKCSYVQNKAVFMEVLNQ